MKKRTKGFLEVAYFLSAFGQTGDGEQYPSPPAMLNVSSWKEAYRIFYETLNDGRTILEFERSMKNARDSFDSHLQNSKRIGWRSENRKPNPLSQAAAKVFSDFQKKSKVEIWEIIKSYAHLDIYRLKQVYEDLIAIQESESDNLKSKTEGGKKIVISQKFERKPTLRDDAIKIHGFNCMVCGFNFEEFYGLWGKGFIEVHHLQALADNGGVERETDPENDLAVICANCHRMIHRKSGITLSIDELRSRIRLIKSDH